MITCPKNTPALTAGFLALVMLGCSADGPAKKKSGDSSLLKGPAQHAQVLDPGVATAGSSVAAVEGSDKSFVPDNHMQTVYFAPNEWKLNDDAKGILKRNAEWLTQNPPYRLEVDGYADSRGAPEQALAMSQRRAAALRDYYAVLGIPKNRIATVALGQTSPVCVQDSEDCWRQNRRGETLIENKAIVSR